MFACHGGYGPPQTQKPAVTPSYGQHPQQSPNATAPQGGNAQPAPYAGGYAQPTTGYGQAPYGQQKQAYGAASY